MLNTMELAKNWGVLTWVKSNVVMQCDIVVVLEYGILLKRQRGYCKYIAY